MLTKPSAYARQKARYAKRQERAQIKRREDAAKAKARRDVIATVWQRDGGTCRACQKPRLQRWGSYCNPALWGHVHEIVFRSLGGDPLNPNACVLVCGECHEAIHTTRKLTLAGTWDNLTVTWED